MKAKDYFEKYKEPLHQAADKEARGKIVIEIFIEMSAEGSQLGKTRNIQREEALMAIIEEMNGKWNALVRLVEKEFGAGVLVRDVFRKVWTEQLKEAPEGLN